MGELGEGSMKWTNTDLNHERSLDKRADRAIDAMADYGWAEGSRDLAIEQGDLHRHVIRNHRYYSY
jgi:hypothetical protein